MYLNTFTPLSSLIFDSIQKIYPKNLMADTSALYFAFSLYFQKIAGNYSLHVFLRFIIWPILARHIASFDVQYGLYC